MRARHFRLSQISTLNTQLVFTFFPPSPCEFCGGSRVGCIPKPSRRHTCLYNDWPNGKSYPVTAAQLLPIRTGFLAPIHFFKLAKNWIEK
jgi:hypothetical protein